MSALVTFLLGVVLLSAQTSYPLPRPSTKISALLFDELSCEPAIVNAGLKLQQLRRATWMAELLGRAARRRREGLRRERVPSYAGSRRDATLCSTSCFVSLQLPHRTTYLVAKSGATPLDGKPQCVTIAGEVRRLSPPSINVLQWLFDHDPTSLRALYAGLAPHHGPDAIETALRELLRSGFLVVSPGD